jgi:hypothetical protein
METAAKRTSLLAEACRSGTRMQNYHVPVSNMYLYTKYELYNRRKICVIVCLLSVDIGGSGIFSNSQNDKSLEEEVHFSQEDLDLKSNMCLVECIKHHQVILE